MDDFAQAVNIAADVQTIIREYKLKPTPQVYAIWYAYLAKTDADLVKSIDILISNKQRITEQVHLDLYERYLMPVSESDPDGVDQVGQNLAEKIDQLMTVLAMANDGINDFGDSMDSSISNMEGSDDITKIKGIVAGLAEEARALKEKNNALSNQLGEASKEINTLRSNLSEVSREALTDGLTGLANRKAIDKALTDRTFDALEHDRPLFAALLDIDHFKKFNDTHGHQIGDLVLTIVARELSKSVADPHMPGRFGGEEFIMLFQDIRLDQVYSTCEGIRNSLAKQKLDVPGIQGKPDSITASIGITKYNLGESITDFIGRADDGLYKAKEAGRNRTVIEEKVQ